jgi:hypothetical protein
LTGTQEEATIQEMGTILRTLVWIAGSALMLPQGWCCYAGTPTFPARTPSTPPQHSCCDTSQHLAAASPSCCETPSSKDDRPSAPPTLFCCCDDLSSDKPPQQLIPTADLAVSPLPPDLVAVAARSAPPDEPTGTPSPPVRVLHCIWLC